MVGLVAFAALGIVVADRWSLQPLAVLAITAALAPIAIRSRGPYALLLMVCGTFFILHHYRRADNPGRQLESALSRSVRQPITATGLVLDEPESMELTPRRSQFRMLIEESDLGEAHNYAGVTALVYWRGPAPQFGARVRIAGVARNIPPAANPGEFDYASYMRRLGVFSEIRCWYERDQEILAVNQGNFLMRHAYAARRWMRQALSLGIHDSPEIVGVIQGMVLGLKNETPDKVRELFVRTGTLHVFVVSGLHIGMFVFIASFLVKPLGVNRKRAVFLLVPLLGFYTLITGLSSGSVRATVMASVLLGGFYADRKPLTLNNLAAAALLMLLWNTDELFMPGFQFSFGVVASIILLAPTFQRALDAVGRPDPFLPRALWSPLQNGRLVALQYLASLLAVSLSAWIGSAPFTTRYFHLLAPSAIFANLFVVPAAFMVLSQGLLSILVAGLMPAAAVLFNNANWLAGHMVLWCVQLFAAMPGGHVYVELPRLSRPPLCEITSLALGAGSAIHVRAGPQDWLIDCGSSRSYESVVRPYLRFRGIDRLAGLVLTHGDYEHVGGAALAVEEFTPKLVVESIALDRSPTRRQLRAAGKVVAVSRGKSFPLSKDTTLRVLYPSQANDARVADDAALVLQIESAGLGTMLMSDSGFVAESWLLEQKENLRNAILIKGQHASDFSGTPKFLNAVVPQVIICQADDFPPSAQIPEDWARDVAGRGIRLFRGDQCGAVTVEFRESGFSVRSFLGNQHFTSRSR